MALQFKTELPIPISSISFADGDIVTVDVTNSNGCVTTFNTITLTVHALATGTLTPC